MKTSLLILSLLANAVLAYLLFSEDAQQGPMAASSTVSLESTIELAAPLDDSTHFDLVMFGNSITDGGKWDSLMPGLSIHKRGYPGFTTSHYRFLVKKKVLSHSPKLVCLMGGINDLGVGIPVERTLENFEVLIEQITSSGAKVLLQSTLYQANYEGNGADVEKINRYLRQQANDSTVFFLDLNRVLAPDKVLLEKYTIDGTHLSEEAYKRWASLLKDFLGEEFPHLTETI